jgi:hypothetical protein
MRLHDQARMRTMRTVIALGAMVASASALVACGGTSAGHSQTRTQAALPTASPSNADVGQARIQVASTSAGAGGGSARAAAKSSGTGRTGAARTHSDTQHRSPGSQTTQKAHQPSGSKNDDNPSNSGPKGLNPCTLVSRSQAQAIIGTTVLGTVEAPLGPTCIYTLGAGRSDLTMAIELQSLRAIKHQMRHRSEVLVAGRRAYCGKLGAQMLFVPLGHHQVLNVTAPCAVAQRFATAALSHLAA